MGPDSVPPASAGERTYAEDPKAYGHAIRLARQAARLTQIELAGILDIPKTTLSEIECGYQRRPAPDTLAVIGAWMRSSPPPEDPEDLGARVRAARENTDPRLSLEALARVCGVSKSSLKRIEQGASPTAAIRTQLEAWLAGRPQPATRSYVRGRIGRGPLRYFIAYDHDGGPGNTMLEMAAEPASVAHVRQLEKHISAETGHSGVSVRGWQPVR
jgi:transcriptional regulator with XRE-family HTH domain